MGIGFDQIADVYDKDFSQTAVGKLQRNIVWNYLQKSLTGKEQLEILELNCGTGKDAIWLASKGHNIMATDVSEKMLDVARLKARSTELSGKVSFALLDISNPDTYPKQKKFDLIFSNFGGFNCIDNEDLAQAFIRFSGLLKPNGRLIAVVMPRFCAWESFYFTFKGKPSEVFRRNRTTSLKVPVGAEFIETWYYSPTEIKKLSKANFNTLKVLPLGFFLPPSYLDKFFERHTKTLDLLDQLEKISAKASFLATFSDHFIIDLEVKS